MYNCKRSQFPLVATLCGNAQAVAKIKGSSDCPNIKGTVKFYKTKAGVLIYAEMNGLPDENKPCSDMIFAFHIHEGVCCNGNKDDPFSNAMAHYNPKNCRHPYHAGDLPPLFGCKGKAVSVFLTDRFDLSDVIGKVVIIHSKPDDFTSQPSGNSGTKIACGVINSTGKSC